MSSKPQSSEMHPGPGLRIKREITRPCECLVRRFNEFETPDISDLMNRLYTMSSEIKNLVNDEPICGPACTVKVYPGDNLMVHKALEVAAPGDVVVVCTNGNTTSAVFGELMGHTAAGAGLGGHAPR